MKHKYKVILLDIYTYIHTYTRDAPSHEGCRPHVGNHSLAVYPYPTLYGGP